jgi:DNA-binding transcriptional ArsR family regulator
MLQSLTQEVSQLEANLYSAFSDPTRILILYALNEQPHNVTKLVSELGINQSAVSRHLKVLRDHGLVQTARQGACITYTLADTRLIEALDILRAVLHDNIRSKANSIEREKIFL